MMIVVELIPDQFFHLCEVDQTVLELLVQWINFDKSFEPLIVEISDKTEGFFLKVPDLGTEKELLAELYEEGLRELGNENYVVTI